MIASGSISGADQKKFEVLNQYVTMKNLVVDILKTSGAVDVTKMTDQEVSLVAAGLIMNIVGEEKFIKYMGTLRNNGHIN